MGVYPTSFLVISPLLMHGYFLSSQMDTGDPGFSDFMENIMFRPDGSGKASQRTYVLVFQPCMYIHVCVACMLSFGHTVSFLIKEVILISGNNFAFVLVYVYNIMCRCPFIVMWIDFSVHVTCI